MQSEDTKEASIAEILKEQYHPIDSISSRVGMHHQNLANSVLDMDTGKHLEYHKLLTHPKFAKELSFSAINKFGQLAQGVGGRVEGTNIMHFIHK